jgi:hypothetical protein
VTELVAQATSRAIQVRRATRRVMARVNPLRSQEYSSYTEASITAAKRR